MKRTGWKSAAFTSDIVQILADTAAIDLVYMLSATVLVHRNNLTASEDNPLKEEEYPARRTVDSRPPTLGKQTWKRDQVFALVDGWSDRQTRMMMA